MEKMLRVPIAELNEFLFVCPECKARTVVMLNRLAQAGLVCASCKSSIRRADNDDALRNFANALTYLQQNGIDMQAVLEENQ